MYIDSLRLNNKDWSVVTEEIISKQDANIVFLFGDSDTLKIEQNYNKLKQLYPNAHIVGASSSGNILGTEISSYPMVATAVYFENSSVEVAKVDVLPGQDIKKLSQQLIDQLPPQDLKHVFIMSEGLNVNGSELINGFNKIHGSFTVSGGMAGDGDRFQETWVIENGISSQNQIVAIGFYGKNLTVSTGCYAGWSSFGADRIVTKSSGNILYELDNQPALDLYKNYLGEFATDLPYSGMRFPLNIRANTEAGEIIRTLLAIDEDNKSITFAGDIPQGYIARLMKPDIDVLIEGAEKAAQDIIQIDDTRGLALIVSCVGRRVVMQELVEEELDSIGGILGKKVHLTGFYSYGEIAPCQNESMQCELHNQTMTLTTIYER